MYMSEQKLIQDETQHRNADYISAMEQRMKDMEREEKELESIICKNILCILFYAMTIYCMFVRR